jgi:hypothetical protein
MANKLTSKTKEKKTVAKKKPLQSTQEPQEALEVEEKVVPSEFTKELFKKAAIDLGVVEEVETPEGTTLKKVEKNKNIMDNCTLGTNPEQRCSCARCVVLYPVKYEPKRYRLFFLEIPGIDYFVVSSFSRQKIDLRKSDKENNFFDVELVNTVNPSSEQQVREWIMDSKASLFSRFKRAASFWRRSAGSYSEKIKEIGYILRNKRHKVVYKHLDHVGTVVSQVEYHGVTLESVEFTKLSYDSGKEICKMFLRFSFDSERFLF